MARQANFTDWTYCPDYSDISSADSFAGSKIVKTRPNTGKLLRRTRDMNIRRFHKASLLALVLVAIGFNSDSNRLLAENGIFSTPKALQVTPAGETLANLIRQVQHVSESPSVTRKFQRSGFGSEANSDVTTDRPSSGIEDIGRDRSELTETEPTDLLFRLNKLSDEKHQRNHKPQDKNNKAENEQTEANALFSRAKATAGHLNRLRKPISEIEISNNTGAARPQNKAPQSLQSQNLVQIVAIGSSAPRPNRYKVGFRHQPLYFEQPNLERCGKAHGIFQNALSGVHFIANTIALPYHMGQKKPKCIVPTKGDCYTCQSFDLNLNPIPISRRGALAESAAIAGFYFLLL